MASKRQRKKNAKKLGTWEGSQYRGGREAGRKNLKKTPEGFENQYGVTFTKQEKQALEQAVNTANRKRKRMLEDASKLPRKLYGQEVGGTVGDLQLMGKESDFILARKTKSLQRFHSKEDYNRYMRNLQRVNSKDYITARIRKYKHNFTKSLLEVYGPDAMDIAMKVRMMKPEEYMRMVEADETLEIRYEPSDMLISGRLNQIRAALGMKLKDEWAEETYSI